MWSVDAASHLNDPAPAPCHIGYVDREDEGREERSTDGWTDGWMDGRPAAAAETRCPCRRPMLFSESFIVFRSLTYHFIDIMFVTEQ